MAQQTMKPVRIPRLTTRLVIISVTVIALGVLAYMIISSPAGSSIIAGSPAFEDKSSNLGIINVVSKDQVTSALGKEGSNVQPAQVSSVLNYQGNLGQTATYNFTLPGGGTASVEVNLMRYTGTDALKSANVFQGTGEYGKINGYDVHYSPAFNLGGKRHYPLIFNHGNDNYTFTFLKPFKDTSVVEYKAQEVLANLIKSAQLL